MLAECLLMVAVFVHGADTQAEALDRRSVVCHRPRRDADKPLRRLRGNGNVTALVRTDGTEAARYEYGPFGELIRANGQIARTNPFRWSTSLAVGSHLDIRHFAQLFQPLPP